MTTIGQTHELAVIRSFIAKDRQERCGYLLSHPERRRKFTDALAHFKWLDDRFAKPIPPAVAHGAGEIVALLKSKGAGTTVWVISESHALDGREMSLVDAMDRTWGSFTGTILSCIPGKLAFFHGEEMRSERLLERLWNSDLRHQPLLLRPLLPEPPKSKPSHRQRPHHAHHHQPVLLHHVHRTRPQLQHQQ